jgi:hypothetical protein
VVPSVRALATLALIAGFAAGAAPLSAQCPSGVKARVLVMVDSSGSMTLHMADNNPAWGDGSSVYKDASMQRNESLTPGFALYPGLQLGVPVCPPGSPPPVSSHDGVNSRLYAAKAALSGLIGGAAQIDWGLMRFTGTTCPIVNTTTSNAMSCTRDSNCPSTYFCIGGSCKQNNNMCFLSDVYDQACHLAGESPLTYSGDCGVPLGAGSAACATRQVCYADADCSGSQAGRCATSPTSAARTCTCVSSSDCPLQYNCTGGRCVYNAGCQNPGGLVVVDPASPGSSSQTLTWLDGIEDLIAGNPELRASGPSPLAGAARAAATWYTNIKNTAADPLLLCRPYVLVQITDSVDTCDPDLTAGPVAAASAFVAATAPNAKRLNTVHVIALGQLGVPNPALDAIAKAGGTGAARLAGSITDLKAALQDIAASVSLDEKCNGADDDCNGACDEPFPGVAVAGPACSNPRAAIACNNGALVGTHCYATGVVVCSADQLSQRCGAPSCPTTPALCPTSEAPAGCNDVDDDCNGVVDDCTPLVAGSCCP